MRRSVVVAASVLAVGLCAGRTVEAQATPQQEMQCWGCLYTGSGFMQGWRCTVGHGNGATCSEYLDGGSYYCFTQGNCGAVPNAGGVMEAVSDGGRIVPASAITLARYERQNCSGETIVYHMDLSGTAIAVTESLTGAREARPSAL